MQRNDSTSDNCPQYLDQTQARCLLQNYSFKNITFWTGAGVECQAPSNLPLSKDLLEQLLQLLLKKEYTNYLLDRWDQCVSFLGDQHPPRMETVLEALKRCEEALNEKTRDKLAISDGFNFFNEAPSNTNSQLLGHAVRKGSDVVTSNYSTVVEREVRTQFKEFENKNVEFDCSICESSRTVVTSTFKSTNGSTISPGQVTHFHGIAEDPSTMGITLRTISRNFPEETRNYFSTMLDDKERLVVFFGYSGSDNYDVNPFFRNHANCDKRKSKASALYISYSATDAKKPAQLSKKACALLEPFGKKYYCCCGELNEILKPSDFSPSKFSEDDLPFNWQDSFTNNAIHEGGSEKFLKDIADVLALVLSEYLGLNIFEKRFFSKKELKDLNQYLKEEGKYITNLYGRRYAEATGFSPSRGKLQNKKRNLGIQYCCPLGIRLFLKQLESPEKIKNRLEKKCKGATEYTWDEITTPENNWMTTAEFSFMKKKNIDSVCRFLVHLKDSLKNIQYTSGLMINEPYHKFSDLRQIAVEHRVHMRASGLFALITEENPEKHCNEAVSSFDEAIQTYIDISSMRGLTQTYSEFAYIEFLWYVCGFKDAKLDRAYLNLIKSGKIAKASEHVNSKMRWLVKYEFIDRILNPFDISLEDSLCNTKSNCELSDLVQKIQGEMSC